MLRFFKKEVLYMRICDLINTVRDIRPALLDDSVYLLWISTIDGRVDTDIFDKSPSEAKRYTPEDISCNTELLIPAPFDICYVHYLCAQCDNANGEYDMYANDYALFNAAFSDYEKYCIRNGLGKKKSYRFKNW